MRKIIFLLIVALGAMSFQAMKQNLAEVNRVQGYYIYIDCRPAVEFDYLGEVARGGAFSFKSPQYNDVRNALIDKARKQFPHADGLIFTFVTGGADRCEAIKFK